jgi:hypothetical protein
MLERPGDPAATLVLTGYSRLEDAEPATDLQAPTTTACGTARPTAPTSTP